MRNQRHSVLHRVAVLAVLAGLFLAAPATGHQDRIPPAKYLHAIYEAPDPIGDIELIYDAREENPTLRVDCDLFDTAVPQKALADLPRPNWNQLEVRYSLTSYDAEQQRIVNQPYLYIQVPLFGPPGESWQQTWVTFHFDHNGIFEKRALRRTVELEENASRHYWPDWPVEGEKTANQVLKDTTDR